MLGLVASIYSYQGKQELYLKQRSEEFNKVIEIAKIQKKNCIQKTNHFVKQGDSFVALFFYRNPI